ncbi:MAG: hypothetical protein GXP41_06910 [Chloroflexi bacterium]|nr:hypothetical protein [Chloroflexota bacterium]
MTDKSLDFGNFIQQVIAALEAAGVKYMIGGAVAVWAWGEPRTTRDLDLVIELPIESIFDLSRELKKQEMLVPPEVILDLLIEQRGDLPINAIHLGSGYKAEFFLLRPGDNLRLAGLQRRRLVDLGPPLGQVYVHSPEDLILNKLRYFALSHQPKHVRDIASILLNCGEDLEYGYIEHWVRQLELDATWKEVLDKTAALGGGQQD